MRIGLIQIDGNLPNLALMKLSAWHKKQGHEVTLMKSKLINQRLVSFDKVYISCIFEENKETAIKMSQQFKNCEIGGVGVNNNKLPDEVNHIMPDYDLYNCEFSIGFTTRGCIRNCSFCKVRQYEGYMKKVCDIYEFWDKKHKEIILLDNNILALPDHFKKIAKQIKKENLKVDFNQGLDHRLLTPEICKILLDLKHKAEIRFAFDHPSYEKSVLKALKMLRDAGMKDWKTRWYIYVSPEDTFESVYKRMVLLRNNKQFVYVMRDSTIKSKKEFIALAKYGNLMGAFKYDLTTLMEKSDIFNSYIPVFEKYKEIIMRLNEGDE